MKIMRQFHDGMPLPVIARHHAPQVFVFRMMSQSGGDRIEVADYAKPRSPPSGSRFTPSTEEGQRFC